MSQSEPGRAGGEVCVEVLRWPQCGCLNLDHTPCTNTARYRDDVGVGFCEAHRDDSLCGWTVPADGPMDFDPDWYRAALEDEDAGQGAP